MGDVRGIRVEFIITCRGVVAVAPVNIYRSYCGKDVSGSGDRIPCPKLKARGLGRDRGGRGCGTRMLGIVVNGCGGAGGSGFWGFKIAATSFANS